jgi:hypothetical protein
VQEKTSASRGSQNGGPQINTQAARIVKSEVERIIGNGALALDTNVSRQRLGQTEKQKRVIDQVRTYIEKDASARPGTFAPRARTKLGTKAIVVRFKANDSSERAARGKFYDRLKVAVVTAILIDGEQTALLLGKLDQNDRFRKSCGERLVHEHVAPRGQTLLRKRKVRFVWRGDDEEADFLDSEKLIERADNADIGIFFGGSVSTAFENRREPQSRHRANYGRVKGTSRESKSDEANIDHNNIPKGLV